MTGLAQGGATPASPPRIGLIGCGAVAQLYYAEALQRLSGHGIAVPAWVYDPEERRALDLASRLGCSAAESFEEALRAGADLVVIASPPRFHAEQSAAALRSGHAVLCEKPMAPSIRDAEAMVAAARDSGGTLAVNFVRRHLGPAKVIRRFLSAGVIGSLRHFEIFEGGPFRWPVSGPGYFEPGSGGGVVLDIGTHVLDLLCWWLGEPERFDLATDAMGGVEANAEMRLGFGQVQGTVRLSRDWHRPNLWVMTGDRGEIRWEANDSECLSLTLADGGNLACDIRPRPAATQSPLHHVPDFPDAFAASIMDAVAAARGERRPLASAEDGLRVVRLIEAATHSARLMKMGWLAPAEAEKAVLLAAAGRPA